MKVILLKDLKKIGKKYDVKDVADGYAINSLIPAKAVLPATQANLNAVQAKKQAIQAEISKSEAELMKAVNEVKGIAIEIKGKVNDKGHLFAGLHAAEIAAAISKQKGVNILAESIELEKPIKEVGEHIIGIKVGSKQANIKLIIKAE
jgi:large subunit ribosomal protein L9